MKMSLQIGSELGKLNADISRYATLARKMPEEAIRKHSNEFSIRLFNALRQIAPAKGAIQAQVLGQLEHAAKWKPGASRTNGIVRESVRQRIAAKFGISQDIASRKILLRKTKSAKQLAGSISIGGKRLNLQALMVQAEIKLRERGRGFLAVAGRFQQSGKENEVRTLSRIRQILGVQNILASDNDAQSRFAWGETGPQSLAVATGLSQQKAQSAILAAVRSTRDNMLEYIRRKTKFPIAA